MERTQAMFVSASLLVYLVTLPFVVALELEDVAVPLLTTAHLYSSLAPVAALPKILFGPSAAAVRETIDPVVAASCMSTVVRAHVSGVEAVHAFFDTVFFASVSLVPSKLNVVSRFGAGASGVAAAFKATKLLPAAVPLFDGLDEIVPAVLGCVGEYALFAGVLALLLLPRVRTVT